MASNDVYMQKSRDPMYKTVLIHEGILVRCKATCQITGIEVIGDPYNIIACEECSEYNARKDAVKKLLKLRKQYRESENV